MCTQSHSLTPVAPLMASIGTAAQRLLQELDAVANRVRRIAHGWEATLAICVDDVLSVPTMFELVQAFCELGDSSSPGLPSGPPTRLRLRSEVLAGTWEALVTGQVDLAIGVGGHHANPGGIELRPLGELEFVFCIAPHHALAGMDAVLDDALLVHHRAVAVADTAQRMAPRHRPRSSSPVPVWPAWRRSARLPAWAPSCAPTTRAPRSPTRSSRWAVNSSRSVRWF